MPHLLDYKHALSHLWDTEAANVIDVYRTEAEGLAMVRELLGAGWDSAHLALGVELDEGEAGDDATLPEVLQGATLARRAYEAATVI